MRHRGDQQLCSIAGHNARYDHHDRPVLQSFLSPPLGLVGPQIGVAKDITRLWRLP